MRSCIYCGRELEKGEVCSCPQSVARRAARKAEQTGGASRESSDKNQSYNNPYRTETSYRTGYAGKDSKFERAKTKRKTRRAARKSAARNAGSAGFFKGLWRYVINFIKAPVEKISNPGYLGKGAILTIAAVQGAVLWLCMYFVLRGGSVGPFRMLASVLSFNGAEGYRLIGTILLVILSGAVGGIVMFLLYAGIFYLINRFIMRLKTPFWEFSVRLAATWIPFTVICAIGAALSLLSPITLMVLILCGAVTVAVLTYEALRTEWISQPASKVLYAMILGYFVFFAIIGHLILL
ncbi:MAG: hypothetical protein LUF26_04140 [Firmicutes bacterium]|nr:hypothetical protein [Bacillota bacterium]